MTGVKTKDKNKSLVYDDVRQLWEYNNNNKKRVLFLRCPMMAFIGCKVESDRRYIISDALGSLRRIYNSGNILLSYFNYDSFGDLLEQGNGSETELSWRGKYFISEDNLYTGVKFYNPNFGTELVSPCPDVKVGFYEPHATFPTGNMPGLLTWEPSPTMMGCLIPGIRGWFDGRENMYFCASKWSALEAMSIVWMRYTHYPSAPDILITGGKRSLICSSEV